MSLHETDLQKLTKLCGMLGSAHDGEIVAAARKATALLAARGATWAEAFQVVPETVEASPAHYQQARELLAHKALLTPFERSFLIGILAHPTLSEKQRVTLEGIARKADAAA